MNKMIQESLRLLYNSEISPEEAEYRVSCEDPKELSRFIVDAFSRDVDCDFFVENFGSF